jgi:hypothetical protein
MKMYICIKDSMMYIGFLKGYTAYEFQIGSYGMRIVRLTGGYYTWYQPWRRVSFQRFKETV